MRTQVSRISQVTLAPGPPSLQQLRVQLENVSDLVKLLRRVLHPHPKADLTQQRLRRTVAVEFGLAHQEGVETFTGGRDNLAEERHSPSPS
ncbi:hypothetical protein D3C78_877450 [compost metagenome]